MKTAEQDVKKESPKTTENPIAETSRERKTHQETLDIPKTAASSKFSAGMLAGVAKSRAETFSFALVVAGVCPCTRNSINRHFAAGYRSASREIVSDRIAARQTLMKIRTSRAKC